MLGPVVVGMTAAVKAYFDLPPGNTFDSPYTPSLTSAASAFRVQVIARRIRECNVYSTILHFNTPAAEIAAMNMCPAVGAVSCSGSFFPPKPSWEGSWCENKAAENFPKK